MVDLMSLDPSCGEKGATLQRPGWAGNNVGFYPFPISVRGVGADDKEANPFEAWPNA
jgi:hypothetical protein